MQFSPAALVLVAALSFAMDTLGQKTAPADAVFVAALSNLKLMKFPEAEAGFRKLTELEPGGIRGYLGVAQVYMAQKKQAEALAWLRAESDRQPLRLDLHVVIGDTAFRAGQSDLALSEFQTVLGRLDPKTDSALEVPRGAPGATLPPA